MGNANELETEIVEIRIEMDGDKLTPIFMKKILALSKCSRAQASIPNI
jgi:hypothetical protein